MSTSPSSSTTGRLEAIWLKRARRLPMDDYDSAHLRAGEGILGNANLKGKRQITLLDADRWAEMCEELGTQVDPRLRRANLFVRGIDLRDSRGRVIQVGSCRIQIHGETRPCRLMDDGHPGLQKALDPDWRGGAYGEALDDGEIRVGDAVTWFS